MILSEEKELLVMLELKLFDDNMCFHKYALSGKDFCCDMLSFCRDK